MIGSHLGSYEILEEIGRGGMGCVYKARQPGLDRIVAVKVLLPQLAADRVFVERFLREAKSIATLEHPGIVTIYDVGEASGTYYFAMQLLDGRPLDEILEDGEPLPYERAVDVLGQMARALDYAHHAGILHRDVKPGNIIITESGHAVLTDFGIAQTLSDTRLTKTGTSIGSPEYMAPEQIEGKKLDSRTDLYSLGVVFYQMLTGSVPYKGESPVAIVYQHVKAPVPSVRDVDRNIPEHLDHVAATLMAKLPEERYASAKELLADLEAKPSGRSARSRRKGSHAAARWVLGTVIVAALALVGTYFWQSGMIDPSAILGTAGPAEETEPAPEEVAEPPLADPGEPNADPGTDPAADGEIAATPPAPIAETYSITSEPAGATVLLDGSTLEQTTPMELELLPGTDYRLRVQLEGHDQAAFNFSLDDLSEAQRGSRVLHFPLRSSTPPGVVRIAADYPVQVQVGGRTYSGERIELQPGTYQAEISAPSVFFAETRELTIASGETEQITLPIATSLTVAANPSRCRVKIDGYDAGYVPAEVRITVGQHVFEFDWESLGQALVLTRRITPETGRVFATPPG